MSDLTDALGYAASGIEIMTGLSDSQRLPSKRSKLAKWADDPDRAWLHIVWIAQLVNVTHNHCRTPESLEAFKAMIATARLQGVIDYPYAKSLICQAEAQYKSENP